MISLPPPNSKREVRDLVVYLVLNTDFRKHLKFVNRFHDLFFGLFFFLLLFIIFYSFIKTETKG